MVKFRVELAAFGVCGLQTALTTTKDFSLATWLMVVDILQRGIARLGILSRHLGALGTPLALNFGFAAAGAGAVAGPDAVAFKTDRLIA